MTESDDWDELNRELGVSKSPARTDDADAEGELPEAEPFADDEGAEADAGEVDEAGGDAEGAENGDGQSDEGQPGTGRKRRRRRRRKKKGPADGSPPAEGGEPAEAEGEPAPVA
ncbi:MAG: hypothetical protein K2X87_23650, partial [Gemmataceae bacterium]|nr:hypothetical protein [Gemmataceae bacterium]